MNDLISRQAGIEAVRKSYDAILDFESDGHTVADSFEDIINALPSAQPEIIYCGECANMQVDSIYHDCWCKETGKKVFVDHYCGYAERKENERKD